MINSDQIPRYHVPGDGLMPSPVMLVGEAPGFQENNYRKPFVGPAGQELNRYLRSAGLFRHDIYVTNLSKFWPPQTPLGKQLPPSKEDIERDAPELQVEIELCQPRIIGAIGAHSARYFLGDRFESMFRDHGIPRMLESGIIVIPLVHPSAGLHSPEEQVRIQWDFEQLGKLSRGQITAAEPTDEYPQPHYERITDEDIEGNGVEKVWWALAGAIEIAIDTEGTIANPWCVTFSTTPGEAYLIRSDQPKCLAALNDHINAPSGNCTVILHYAAHDIPVLEALGIRVVKYRALNPDGTLTLRDTMSDAYLLGGVHPKGLKPLAWRLCGMQMVSYQELVGPAEVKIAHAYLEKVFSELVCPFCWGSGRGESRKYLKPGCTSCGGSGRVSGKRAGTTKQCSCVKTTDKCAECVDGMMIPKPEKEFVFDPGKSEWRWKQPQSVARWIKRKLGKLADEDEDQDSDIADLEGSDDAAGVEFFKLRHDWEDIGTRNDKAYVEMACGRMPKTTLSDVEDQEAVTRYACRDADATLRISRRLLPLIENHQALAIQEVDAAIIPMLSRMEQVGMRIDVDGARQFAAELEGELDEIRDRLSGILGEKTNPNSPKIADVLFKQLGLPVIKLTKSKTREAIDDDVLGALKARLKKKAGDPIAEIALAVIDCVTDYRERQKLLTTYCLPLLEKADGEDRVHTTLKYTHVATGRLSSEDPNLQNIPNPHNSPVYGKRMRNLFVARPGYKLISCDYSQIEMIVGAHLTQDPGMLKAFREGLDLHKVAASMMFDIPYEEVPGHIRTQTKPLNFGAFYGLSAMGLQMQFASFPDGAIEKSEAECEELIRRYYEAFPGVMEWKRKLWAEGRRTGYVETMLGRKRLVPGLRSDISKVRAAAEREAANQPIQGTAQDILRIGMRNIWEKSLPMFWAEGIDIQCVMQVHDELLFECQEDYAELVLPVIVAEMQYAVELSVPIKVGTSIGNTWAELK